MDRAFQPSGPALMQAVFLDDGSIASRVIPAIVQQRYRFLISSEKRDTGRTFLQTILLAEEDWLKKRMIPRRWRETCSSISLSLCAY